MQTKTETWSGHSIRFVMNKGEWWAIAKDVATALGYKHNPHMLRLLDEEERDDVLFMDSIGRNQKTAIISETGIYEAAFNSNNSVAKEFKRWVKQVLKTMRQETGLEGFQVFRMLDKEHQKDAMKKLRDRLKKPVRVDFIKANTIANKAVSSKYGHPKLIKKDQMTPNMLVDRQGVLDDTVDLMDANERFNLNLSVSEKIYEKHVH